MVFGHPFLTSFFQYTEMPWIGRVPTASALLFDLGVFMLVVGSTVLMLVAIAHQSIRTAQDQTNRSDDEAEPATESQKAGV